MVAVVLEKLQFQFRLWRNFKFSLIHGVHSVFSDLEKINEKVTAQVVCVVHGQREIQSF